MKKILIIDDEKKLANVLMMNFQRRGFKVLTANTGKDGVKAFKEFKPICVITDLKLPDFDGFEVIKKIKEIDFDVPIILITAYGSVEKAVNAVKLGAYDFVTKPFEFKSLFKLVNESMDMLSVVTNEKNYLDHEVAKVFPGIIGKSKKMKEIFNLIADISGSIAIFSLPVDREQGRTLWHEQCIMSASVNPVRLLLSIVPLCRKNYWKPNFSVMKKELLPEQIK